jgi:hypothetical protein
LFLDELMNQITPLINPFTQAKRWEGPRNSPTSHSIYWEHLTRSQSSCEQIKLDHRISVLSHSHPVFNRVTEDLFWFLTVSTVSDSREKGKPLKRLIAIIIARFTRLKPGENDRKAYFDRRTEWRAYLILNPQRGWWGF